jgi:hypothetical protein
VGRYLDEAKGGGSLEGLEEVLGGELVVPLPHLLGDDAHHGEHAHTAVLQLSGAELGNVT